MTDNVTNLRTITIEKVIAKGEIPWFAEPGGPHPHTSIKFVFPISLEDYLLLTGSRVAGYTVTITPIKQPLPQYDEGVGQWVIPGLEEAIEYNHVHNFGVKGLCSCGADVLEYPESPHRNYDAHEHTFIDRLCTCGERQPLPEGHERHRYGSVGRCECGQVHPTHTFVDGVCVCGEVEITDV